MNENWRAVVVRERHWQKVIASLLVLIICMFIAGTILSIQTNMVSAKDDKDKCPDGHTCFYAIKEKGANAGEKKCFPDTANLGEGWTWTDESCSEREVKPLEPTKTQELPKPTSTEVVVEPTDEVKPTKTPFSPPLDEPTTSEKPTPTVVYQIFETQTCDWCSAVTSLDRIANALEAIATQMAKP